MQFTQVSYKRVKNLGNYQSESVELVALIEPREELDDVFNALKRKACYLLNITPYQHDEEEGEISF